MIGDSFEGCVYDRIDFTTPALCYGVGAIANFVAPLQLFESITKLFLIIEILAQHLTLIMMVIGSIYIRRNRLFKFSALVTR